MIAGFATAQGTARFRDRFPALAQAAHFRQALRVRGVCDLWLSSIGLGTYLGETTAEADAAYAESIAAAVNSGVNVLDTAINYRNQRSERNIGAAIKQLVESGSVERDELLVCTKAGFLAFDGETPGDPQSYFISEYINKGVMRPGEIAGGSHCMAATYLENQLERSRKNLGLETIDVFYLHNPETQLSSGVSLAEFRVRLRAAFEALENSVRAGKIRFYGCATWNAFRVPPGQRDYMGLEETLAVAREVGGEQHHCRFIQSPFNLAMAEAFTEQNQSWQGEKLSLLEAAARAGVAVVGSATLYQARLMKELPALVGEKLGTASHAESAIQFARSAPGLAVALIGMARKTHVIENLRIAEKPAAETTKWMELFQKT